MSESPLQRAFKNAVEEVESKGYPTFFGNQMLAEDKVGECAGTFGGFSVYVHKTGGLWQCYMMTLGFPGAEEISQGHLTITPEYAATLFERMAQAIRDRVR